VITSASRGLGSSDSSPRALSPQNQALADALKAVYPDTLGPVEAAAALGIGMDKWAGSRFTELYDTGLAEPVGPRYQRDGRQQWRWVPPPQRCEVAKAAFGRRKTALLHSMQRQEIWLQGWAILQLLAPGPHPETEERQLQTKTCPGKMDPSLCDCVSVSVWVSRHYRQPDVPKSRAKIEAEKWRKDRKAFQQSINDLKRDNPTVIQFMNYRTHLHDAAHYVAQIAGFVEDEIDFQKETGYSQISDASWEVIEALVPEIQGELDRLSKGLGILIHGQGDWIDAEDIVDAEILELDG
jgi:hypothetical protein